MKSLPTHPKPRKKTSKHTPDGVPVHSFDALLVALATQARITYRVGTAEATFTKLSLPTPLHQRAFDLLGV